MTEKEKEEKKPLGAYLLRNIPYELNKKLKAFAKKTGRSKRIVIFDALEQHIK